MTSQQFPRHGMPVSAGVPQIPGVGNLVPINQPKQQAGGDLEGGRDGDHAPQDHPPSGGGGGLGFRDDKQDTVVVRPYPQVQTHGQPQVTAQAHLHPARGPRDWDPVTVHLPQGQPTALTEGQVKMESPMPSRLIAPAPASNQAHLSGGPKGHSSNLHQLMSGNIQIIRSGTPVQIGTSAVPPQTFTSHLPRVLWVLMSPHCWCTVSLQVRAAAAVMSSSKTSCGLLLGPAPGPASPTSSTSSSRPSRTQSPVINPVVTHTAEMVHVTSSALPAAGGVGVATTVHLNPMQLMTVDRLGLPTPQIGGQGLQPTPLTAQGLQPTPLGVQGLHPSASITTTQALQQAPGGNQQQQSDGKPGMVLADGFVASTICSTFGATQPATAATMTQGHAQAGGGVGGGAPTLASSPRPSILRKKPTNDG
ncbi:hypothetical protein CRUP_031854 [Coryphaenoides rupestris]|nr:hypothetical protein CRUP_031854 [Coryphaenoides rupestris]